MALRKQPSIHDFSYYKKPNSSHKVTQRASKLVITNLILHGRKRRLTDKTGANYRNLTHWRNRYVSIKAEVFSTVSIKRDSNKSPMNVSRNFCRILFHYHFIICFDFFVLKVPTCNHCPSKSVSSFRQSPLSKEVVVFDWLSTRVKSATTSLITAE